MPKHNLPVISFVSPSLWEDWLAENHGQEGIWLRIFKKNSGEPSVSYAEALDEALCYGWIDGQRNKYDERSYLQKFTPRRKKSIWSKVNTGHVERLIETGRMKAAGLKEIDAAKQDGRWRQAYDSHKNMTLPEDFLSELEKIPKAKTFFETLNKTNRYSIGFRLQTAKKPETREKKNEINLRNVGLGRKISLKKNSKYHNDLFGTSSDRAQKISVYGTIKNVLQKIISETDYRMNNQIKIVSYFSIPTDLAGEMRSWKEFVSGEDYSVDLNNDETGETVTIRYFEVEDGFDFVKITSNAADELFDRVIGRTILALSMHSDDLMVYR